LYAEPGSGATAITKRPVDARESWQRDIHTDSLQVSACEALRDQRCSRRGSQGIDVSILTAGAHE